MAGKIHAVITRPYNKWRDYYDLLWYLTKRPPESVNLKLLRAALKQTQVNVEAKDWKTIILQHIKKSNWKNIIEDVSPFLERPSEIEFLNKKSFAELLKG